MAPANNVSPAIAEAGSISGALARMSTAAEAAPARVSSANAAVIFLTIFKFLELEPGAGKKIILRQSSIGKVKV